jgi:hypothetical protein
MSELLPGNELLASASEENESGTQLCLGMLATAAARQFELVSLLYPEKPER